MLHLWNYFLGGYYYDSVSSFFPEARWSDYRCCCKCFVYIYEGTDAGIKTKVENLNKDKTKTTYIPFMSSTDYAKGFVSSYLKGTGLVVDTDEGKTTYKVATEGENKGKLVVYVKVAS